MASNKSLDEITIIEHLLHDVQTSCGSILSNRALRLTCLKARKRFAAEGLGFLMKTLPRLGKAFDKALSGGAPLNSIGLGFDALPDSKLPRFLGELFSRVLDKNGMVLPDPCAKCVQCIRQVTYLFYKYEQPYNDEQKSKVIAQFVKAEQELSEHSATLQQYAANLSTATHSPIPVNPKCAEDVARKARLSLFKLFRSFDPYDIVPNHGPGAVATKQTLWDKYVWTNIARRITDKYPLDAFFYASCGHFCDSLGDLNKVTDHESPARVILVPKDSRGPRLISCEPVDFQWIQQGLMTKIVRHVESHALTKHCVFFTDQSPNRIGALHGSSSGKYATLDLKEASDRVSIDLVRLLFPEPLLGCLEACRSLSTELPDGSILPLRKFAPMGSALCFPVMALTIWAILDAVAPDAYTRERIHVYGDDVIVPTAFAANAIEQLELFGLKVNRDKCCISGLFRESCGMDAFKGVPVTPVRFRTVWSSSPSPESYVSWISYANSMYDRKCYSVYNYIVERLIQLYGPIPDDDMNVSCPSLRVSPVSRSVFRRRYSERYQKYLYYVRVLKAKKTSHELPGWSMLLRFFTEGQRATPVNFVRSSAAAPESCLHEREPFSVRQYTHRRSSMLVRQWR